MLAQEKQIEKKVLFWSLLGPSLVIFSLFILLFKVSAGYIYIPLAALIGVPICWYWQIRGLTAVLGSFLLFLIIHYYRFNDDASAWNIGLSITLALAFVISTLSFREIESIFGTIAQAIPTSEKIGNQEKSLWLKEKATLEKDILEKQELIISQDKLIELSREEILALHHEKETAQQRLATATAEMGKLEENYESLEQERQRLIQESKQLQQQHQSQNDVDKFKSRIIEKDKQLEQLRILLDYANSKNAQLEHHLEMIETDLFHLREIKGEYEKIAINAENMQQHHENILNEVHNQVDNLTREKGLLESTLTKLQAECEDLKTQLSLSQSSFEVSNENVETVEPQDQDLYRKWRRAEGLHNQLREQFEEKSDLLDYTRKVLFHTQEALAALQLETKEQTVYSHSENEKALENTLIKQHQKFETEIQLLQEEVDALHNLITHFFKKASGNPL